MSTAPLDREDRDSIRAILTFSEEMRDFCKRTLATLNCGKKLDYNTLDTLHVYTALRKRAEQSDIESNKYIRDAAVSAHDGSDDDASSVDLDDRMNGMYGGYEDDDSDDGDSRGVQSERCGDAIDERSRYGQLALERDIAHHKWIASGKTAHVATGSAPQSSSSSSSASAIRLHAHGTGDECEMSLELELPLRHVTGQTASAPPLPTSASATSGSKLEMVLEHHLNKLVCR
jgi:hypothetical protein